MCDEIISVIDSALTNVTNTVLKNVMCTVSIHFNNKKVRYKMNCYILHTF